MDTKNKKVSVIIPTFKRSDYLVRAINSVLNQTYKNIEIIVVDDNDGDDEYRKVTKSMIQPYLLDKSILYLEHSENKGLPSARNTGVKSATGIYIAFLDDDDEWLPEKIEKQINLFDTLPEDYGIVSCGWNLIHSVNHYKKELYPNYKGDLSKILALNHFSPPSMVVIKKEAFDRVGGFDENFRWRQDIELYFRLAPFYLFDYVPEVLVNYYYHPESMSRNFKKKLEAVERFINKHRKELKKNNIPWSEINERKGDLAAASGKRIKAVKAFLIAGVNSKKRAKIVVIKAMLSLLGGKYYIKIRKL